MPEQINKNPDNSWQKTRIHFADRYAESYNWGVENVKKEVR